LTIAKREPGPIGSALRSSALLTRPFHCVSLRRSASVSKTCSGGHAIPVLVVTCTRAILYRRPGPFQARLRKDREGQLHGAPGGSFVGE
jgi:hypothetical protein